MIYDSKKKENVSLTGGIWWQAGKEYEFDPKSELTQNDLIDIMKEAFTGNGGNKRKVLIGGSDFIGRINKLEITKVVSANDDFVKWGIDFSEIKSKFGKLFILYSEVFDDCGMSDYGFIFDPEFISKWGSRTVRKSETRSEGCWYPEYRCSCTYRSKLLDPALSGSSYAYCT